MISSLIDKIFVNKKDDILQLLSKYHLNNIISSLFHKINNLQAPDLKNNSIIGALTSSFLTRLNAILEKIESIEDKEQLEYILSEISNEFTYQLLQKEGISQEQVLTEIKESLITTCEINNWDIELLLKRIKIDLRHTLLIRSDNGVLLEKIDNSNSKIYYYEWLRKSKHFTELIHDMKDKKLIKSINEIKQLFSKHSGKIQVKMDSSQIDFIVLLFDQMKNRKLIKPCGTKGQFFPLKKYCIDFNGKELFKKDPKRIKELIKRDDAKHAILLEEINILIGNK